MSSASDKSDATAASRLISSAAALRADFFFFFGDLLCGQQAVGTSCFLSPLKSEAAGCKIVKHFKSKQLSSNGNEATAAASVKIRPIVLSSNEGLHTSEWAPDLLVY